MYRAKIAMNWMCKMGQVIILLFIGYLLGNAFPTFEVVPYGYKSLTGNPLQLNLGECAPECEDFNDEVK